MLNPPPFRGLSDPFLDALEALVTDKTGQWWRDVLAHPDLILSIRSESLNVYHRGASLFRVTLRQGRPVPETHVKYLVRRRQALAELEQSGSFGFTADQVLWHSYAGAETLSDMIQAANALTGPEKSLLHPLIQASPNVVDVEIALAGEALGGSPDEETASSELATDALLPGTNAGKKTLRQDRIDAASLETRGDPKRAFLVFHEAKHFANSALRASPKRRPEVLNQLGRYHSSISQNSAALSLSYPFVCQALVRLDAMRRLVRKGLPFWADRVQPGLDPVIQQVAAEARKLVVETRPRLVIFGFDADQRDGALASILDRLEQEFDTTVYAIGNPKGIKTTPAFQPSKAVLDAHAKIMADEAVEAAKPPPPPPPAVITAPADAPIGVSLLFDARVGEVRPVYLVNTGPTALSEVVVTVGSAAGDPVSPLGTRKLDGNDGTVPTGKGALIDHYGVFWDGDVLTVYQIDYSGADGARWRAQAFVDTGGSPARCVKLKTAVVAAPAGAPDPSAPV